MALVRYGNGVSEIRGSIAGNVFSRNRAGVGILVARADLAAGRLLQLRFLNRGGEFHQPLCRAG